MQDSPVALRFDPEDDINAICGGQCSMAMAHPKSHGVERGAFTCIHGQPQVPTIFAHLSWDLCQPNVPGEEDRRP